MGCGRPGHAAVAPQGPAPALSHPLARRHGARHPRGPPERRLTTPIYLESSVVLAWLLGEPASDWVRNAVDGATSVQTSRLTVVEVERGLVRAVHDGRVSEADARRARSLLARAASQWAILALSEPVCARAGQAFPVEPVRALDALHLASALEGLGAAADLRMLSLDERITRSAEALGIEAVEPPSRTS